MIPAEEMLDWIDRRMWSLNTYIEDHGPGSKRPMPETIIAGKLDDIAKFTELRGAYVKALNRKLASEAAA
jgi:hypothetical protein